MAVSRKIPGNVLTYLVKKLYFLFIGHGGDSGDANAFMAKEVCFVMIFHE